MELIIELGLVSDHSLCVEILFGKNKKKHIGIRWFFNVSGTGITMPFHNTENFAYNINNSQYYYSKTIIQFKKITLPLKNCI